MDPLATSMAPIRREFWTLARLAEGWDGDRAPPPSPLACERAHLVVTLALARGLPPTRMVPDVMGGLSVYWFGVERTAGGGHRLAASLSIDNDGDLVASTVDRVTQAMDAWDVSLDALDATLTRLWTFTASEARATG